MRMVLLLGSVLSGLVFLLTVRRQATLYKLRLWKNGILFFLFAKDSKWVKHQHHSALKPAGECKVQEKVLIFLRHGESTWNVTFNRSKNPIFFIPRILYALWIDTYLLFAGIRDSWFYDAALCDEGLEQANELRKHLQGVIESVEDEGEDFFHVLKGTSGKRQSRLVTSNLRRSMSTIIIALHDRLQETEEKITVLPSLQEISRNIDTISLTPPKTEPEPSWIESTYPLDIPKAYRTSLDISLHTGTKSTAANGLKRILSFASWVFSSVDEPVVVVSGHSLWFKYFFQEFLPVDIDHKAKNKKIANGGAVAFTFRSETFPDGTSYYSIDPSTIKVVWKGFQ